MKKRLKNYQLVPYPKMRRAMAVMLRSIQGKPMAHGLLEVDVTRARAFLGTTKRTPGVSVVHGVHRDVPGKSSR